MTPQSNHIFISYKNEESAYANQMRTVLEGMGYAVWWDIRIQTGQAWHEEIDQQLNSSRCVIVLWSRRSIESKWVGLEAANAITRGVYVPCCIERVAIPSPFNRLQAASLVGWDGRTSAAEFRNVVDRIAELLGPPINGLEQAAAGFDPWPESVPRPLLARTWSWVRTNAIATFALSLTLIALFLVYSMLTNRMKDLEKLAGQQTSDLARYRAVDLLIQQMHDECKLLVWRARQKLTGSPAKVGTDDMKSQLTRLAREDLGSALNRKNVDEARLSKEFGVTAQVEDRQTFAFTIGMLNEIQDYSSSAKIEQAMSRTLIVCEEFEVALGFLATALRRDCLKDTQTKR